MPSTRPVTALSNHGPTQPAATCSATRNPHSTARNFLPSGLILSFSGCRKCSVGRSKCRPHVHTPVRGGPGVAAIVLREVIGEPDHLARLLRHDLALLVFRLSCGARRGVAAGSSTFVMCRRTRPNFRNMLRCYNLAPCMRHPPFAYWHVPAGH
eukprot:7304366-Prymnesium_polylepis.3